MQARGFVSVKVVALHFVCGRCGDTARVEHSHPDTFTSHILQPAVSWWTAHLDPQLVLLEVVADGEHQEWAATG